MIAESHSLTGMVAPTHDVLASPNAVSGDPGYRKGLLGQLSQRQAQERHVPVMLDRCLELLEPAISRQDAVVIDGTLGMGGHTEAMLERFSNLMVIGIDRDAQAHAIAVERLARFGDRFVPVHTVYDHIEDAMSAAGVTSVDGVLLDLGVSSMQLDERSRGFAYSYDAPLDMRMNGDDELTARIVVNEYSENQLRRIIKTGVKRNLLPVLPSILWNSESTHPSPRLGNW